MTTLHGSTDALEVNLGGFKLANAFESTIVDGIVKFNGSSGGGAPGGYSSNHQMNGHASTNGLNGLSMNMNGVGGVSGAGLSSSFNGHMTSSSSANGLNSLGLGGQEPHISLSHSFSGPGMKPVTTSSIASQHGVIPSSTLTGNILNPPQSAGPLGSHNRGGQGTSGLSDFDDEISDVFHGLSFRDPLTAAPGYDRSRFRCSSAPCASLSNASGGNRTATVQNGYGLWGGFGGSDNHLPVLPDSDDSDEYPLLQQQQQQQQQGGKLQQHHLQQQQPGGSTAFPGGPIGGTWGAGTIQSQNIWGGIVSSGGPTVPFQTTTGVSPAPQTQLPPQAQHIVQHQQGGGGSRPNSQTSSYSGSNSDQSGFSPIYSPTGTSGFGGFSPINNGIETSCAGLLTTGPMFSLGEERESRSLFNVGIINRNLISV